MANIKLKIKDCRKYDNKRFGVKGTIDFDFINNLIKEQNQSCAICNSHVEIDNYKPYCCYQFSIDRIDNSLPHNKDNVRITCYYCNCKDHPRFDQHNGCKSLCHGKHT